MNNWPRMDRPKLSIIVATVGSWAEIRVCLESLKKQSDSSRIELIIADGTGFGLPDDEMYSNIVWLCKKRASIFQLRALGLERSRGDIIAFTEDHCRVAFDWAEQIIELHDRYPEMAAIGGVVENGATGSILDWVHFLIANGPYMKPLRPDGADLLTGQANVSFKKRFLPAYMPDSGIFQMFINRDLIKEGHKFMMSEKPVVWHVQSLGLLGTCRMHFHTGRTIAGFRILKTSAIVRFFRLMSCAILPFFLVLRTFHTVHKKRRERFNLIMGLPYLCVLAFCHSVGESLGYVLGAGNSPYLVR
jgi:glycosyltransferase involved in cell wall biosynthesis